jgi:rhodanese-related sulfurtransferase
MNVTNITLDDLLKLMSSGKKYKLVDVLDAEHYAKIHIKGAISIPLAELREKAETLLKKDETIVTYCASFSCPASTTAAKILMSLGYKNVIDYKGGIKEYADAKLPLEGTDHA